ncbi:hypothetical protein [Brevundimonas sp.]|uniref:hypothetical protein n=1 Tax=Brevundimonas sp. TaxID=1871086 RepID=UPI002B87EABB|nr:hypothetical protein [Brevundimonas sp.]HWQ85769.1 hypothetical protein [Brevundimonas sp.]
MLIPALLMVGALTTGDPDGVVATAPATPVDLGATIQPAAPSVDGAAQAGVPHNLTTDEQIDRWIATRSVDHKPYAGAPGESIDDDGKPHGEVSVGIGTGGFRDYGATISMPIGENGRLSLSYRQTRNGYPYGGYGYGYGYGGRYGGAVFDDGGYVFPGYRPGAAAQFESRTMGSEGPADQPLIQPDR